MGLDAIRVLTQTLLALQVDQWLEFAGSLGPGAGLEGACAAANEYLQLRTFLVGYRLSLADLACWGQLAGATLPFGAEMTCGLSSVAFRKLRFPAGS